MFSAIDTTIASQHGMMMTISLVHPNHNQVRLSMQMMSNRSIDLISIVFPSDEDDDKIVDRISWDNDEPTICIEISNIYVYDFDEENEGELCQTVIASSSASSCFDDHTSDNDDGYSTHSLDDTEQATPPSLSIPSCKLIVPFFDDSHRGQAQEDTSSIRRLIDQLMWLSPFKKTVRQMMINDRFG
jgi:hypothetical protein